MKRLITKKNKIKCNYNYIWYRLFLNEKQIKRENILMSEQENGTTSILFIYVAED